MARSSHRLRALVLSQRQWLARVVEEPVVGQHQTGSGQDEGDDRLLGDVGLVRSTRSSKSRAAAP